MAWKNKWRVLALSLFIGTTGFNQVAEARSYSVGGSVTGLMGTGLVLQNNGTNNLAIVPTTPPGGNVKFTFSTKIATGTTYKVTILTQPSNPTQVCSVTNGNGKMAKANVTNVAVNCVTSTFSVSGNTSGLAGAGLTLLNNGTDTLAVNTNGAFTFAARVSSGNNYTVTVAAQPTNPWQTCSVSNGNGTVTNANITNVGVACATNTYRIGGSVTGLAAGATLTLANGVDSVNINVDGTFQVGTVASGNAYSVLITSAPVNQTCTLTNGSGMVTNADINSITVKCAMNTTLGLYVGNMGGPGNIDGIGSLARFNFNTGLVVDHLGTLFIVDTNNHTIRRLSPDGTVSTFAGKAGQYGAADGTGGNARFFTPRGIAIDTLGNLYVADTGNNTIRKILIDGTVSTLAGRAGASGFANGEAANALFSYPADLAIDSAFNIYVTDVGNSVIRKISPSGMVSTYAGTPVVEGAADGPALSATFRFPVGIALDSSGKLFVADTYNQRIRVISSDGVVSTIAGSIANCGGLGIDGTGLNASFCNPIGLVADKLGNVYVADSSNNLVRRIDANANVTTIAGRSLGFADGSGENAKFNYPQSITIDQNGILYVGDSSNTAVRRITPDGTVSTLAGSAEEYGVTDGIGATARFANPQGLSFDSVGTMYVVDNTGLRVRKVTPGGAVTAFVGLFTGAQDGTGSEARFRGATTTVVDSTGNIFVSDTDNHTLRKITPNGTVSTYAGAAGYIGFQDGPAMLARFNRPTGLAIDRTNTLYVADSGNNVIRKVSPDGTVTTLPGSFFAPMSVALDAQGNLYIAVSGNHTIAKIAVDGAISTLAGQSLVAGYADGQGTAALFNRPMGITTDLAGNLYVTDNQNNAIRKVTPNGDVTTFAGVSTLLGFVPGVLPGVLTQPRFIARYGNALYITLYNGVAVIENLR